MTASIRFTTTVQTLATARPARMPATAAEAKRFVDEQNRQGREAREQRPAAQAKATPPARGPRINVGDLYRVRNLTADERAKVDEAHRLLGELRDAGGPEKEKTAGAAPALGWTDGQFLDVYAGNRATAHEVILEGSPVAPFIRTLAEAGTWEGTAGELLETLNGMAPDATRKLKTWPATGRTLAGALRRMAPSLRKVGVEVTFSRVPGGSRRRVVTVQKIEVDHRPDRPDRPESASGVESEGTGGDDRDAGGTVAGTVGTLHRPAETPRQSTLRDDRDGRDDESPTQSERQEELWTM